MRFFCFGWGYSVSYLGRLLEAEGWQLSGTVRTAEKCEALQKQGIEAFLYSDTDSILQALGQADVVLSSVPPVEGEDIVLQDFGEVLKGFKGWLGYLSTTGVYGDRNGGWVDETSDLLPTSARGEARVKAESGWQPLGAHIFRIAGIYGSGRNALTTIKKGKSRRVFKENHVFSRIHVKDIAAIVKASIDKPNPKSVYNVCDDEAAPPQDVIAYACDLLGVKPPPLVPIAEAELSPMAQSFYADSKRVSNEKIKRDLQIRLQYPNYRVGLQTLLEEA